MNIELTIGSKTLLTKFLVIDEKGSYSLLHGRDWIHRNCCVPSTNIQMAFLLSSEFRAPADQEVYSDFDESKYEEIVAKLTVAQQAIFDKLVKHRHLKALYVKGFVDGKPMNKMLVDGDASVNLMPYTTFYKLGKGP